MNDVFRAEKKYILNVMEMARAEGYLDSLLLPDPHNGRYGYVVRSLYFDTVADKDFFDKKDGLETRKKIRLRRLQGDWPHSGMSPAVFDLNIAK